MEREEALEVMRRNMPSDRSLPVYEALQTLIPELRESEDERIIKTLQEYVKNRNWMLNGPSQGEVLAWLEKQKGKMTAEEFEKSELFQLKLKTKYDNGYQDGLAQKEQKPLSTEETELNSIAFLEQMGYTCVPPKKEHQNNSDAPKNALGGALNSPLDKDKNLDDIAQDYVEAVKEYNPEPTWNLMQTAVCYGYHYCEQEEQKPAAEEILAKAGLKPYKEGNQWCILAGDNIQEGICGFGDTIDEALYEFLKEVLIMANSPQLKEQKPEEKPINWTELTWKDIDKLEGIINNVHYEFRNGIGQESFGKEVLEKFREYKGDECLDKIEQKPAEWSAEDEKLFWGLTTYIPNEELEELGVTRGDILKKLKSIRPQSIQLKEAYKDGFQTARDAIALAFMNYLDENRPDGKMCLSNGECEEIKKAFFVGDWAKIMRYYEKYRPHWKPSEEQMKALEECGECKRCIKELYEQLKKLM